jgi:hypothetical protein
LTNVWAIAALCASAGCSLLAPSDEALTGGDPQVDDAGDAGGDRAAARCGKTVDCDSRDCCSLVCDSTGLCAPCLATGSPCGSSGGAPTRER